MNARIHSAVSALSFRAGEPSLPGRSLTEGLYVIHSTSTRYTRTPPRATIYRRIRCLCPNHPACRPSHRVMAWLRSGYLPKNQVVGASMPASFEVSARQGLHHWPTFHGKRSVPNPHREVLPEGEYRCAFHARRRTGMRLIAKEGEWGCDVSRSKYLQEEKRRTNRKAFPKSSREGNTLHPRATRQCKVNGPSGSKGTGLHFPAARGPRKSKSARSTRKSWSGSLRIRKRSFGNYGAPSPCFLVQMRSWPHSQLFLIGNTGPYGANIFGGSASDSTRSRTGLWDLGMLNVSFAVRRLTYGTMLFR